MSKNRKRAMFLRIFKEAEKKYGSIEKRLAGEGWEYDWQTLIATILSAQSRDETTIPVTENLFRRYGALNKLAYAKYKDVLSLIRKIKRK